MKGRKSKLTAWAIVASFLGYASYGHAQTKLRFQFPSCELSLTTDGHGVFADPQEGGIRGTASRPWRISDGCRDMFAEALGVVTPSPELANGLSPTLGNGSPTHMPADAPASEPISPAKVSTAEVDQTSNASISTLDDARDAIREKQSLVDLLVRAAEAPRSAARSRDESSGNALTSIITSRIQLLDRNIATLAAPSSDPDAEAKLRDLRTRNEELSRKETVALSALKDANAREASARTQRDLLNQWLVTVIIMASLLLATVLLTWIGLTITQRSILSKDRSDIENLDRRWIRESIEEHQWLARHTRMLPYAIAALMVLSALGVLLNVIMSGETIIEPVKGGALLATLIAMLGIAKAASSWRDGIERRVLELFKTDADLAKS